jgi:hypothetical protein
MPCQTVRRSAPARRRGATSKRAVGRRSCALDELFPGFEKDLADSGAVPYRAGMDIRIERPGVDPFPQRDL